jgi:hypothetical protein
MTVNEAYKRFLIKINKNDSNSDVRVSEAHFVLLFNEFAPIWLSEKIEEKLATDSINDLEELHEVVDLPIDIVKSNESYFILPNDFFKYINSTVEASNKFCTKRLYVYRFKPKNKNIYLSDEFTKPSFEWEETLLSLAGNKAIVYTDNFDVNKLTLEYYKFPDKIDIEGYINADGLASETINPNLSDIWVNEIINRCAQEITRITLNPDGFQLSETRIQKETK